jgi:hypothetical protein
MIVWAGQGNAGILNDGARYIPHLAQWNTVAAGPPDGVINHSAVWTGDAMIMWGGELSSGDATDWGGIYDPGADSWTPTSTDFNCHPPACHHAAVWTDMGMFISHGYRPSMALYSVCTIYDPVTNWWTKTPDEGTERGDHTAVWTGSQVIVWGGQSLDGMLNIFLNTGSVYTP